MALSMVCAQKTPGFLRFVNQETSQHDPLTPRGFVGEWLRLSNFCCGLMAPGCVKKHASTNQRYNVAKILLVQYLFSLMSCFWPAKMETVKPLAARQARLSHKGARINPGGPLSQGYIQQPGLIPPCVS